MKLSSDFKIYLLLVGAIVFWGCNWPMSKIGIEYMPTLWHAAIRLGLACLCMFVITTVLGKFKIPSKQDLPIIFALGLFQMGIFTLLINLGLVFVDAGRSAILVYTVPLWVMPIALIVFKEKLNGLKLIGLGLGFLGILILFSPWSIDWHNTETLIGNSLLIGAAICMAISICTARRLTWHSSSLELLPWQLLVATIPVLIIACIFSPVPQIQWTQTSMWAMAYSAILATAFANGFITVVSNKLPSSTVSLGLLGVPLTGVISAVLILDETVTQNMAFAMFFIFSGLLCVVFSAKMPRKSEKYSASTPNQAL